MGGKHREDDRFREWNEQITSYSVEKEHREEDDTDAKCRYERRDRNLGCTIKNCFTLCVTFFREALDILDGDGSLVHQDANS